LGDSPDARKAVASDVAVAGSGAAACQSSGTLAAAEDVINARFPETEHQHEAQQASAAAMARAAPCCDGADDARPSAHRARVLMSPA